MRKLVVAVIVCAVLVIGAITGIAIYMYTLPQPGQTQNEVENQTVNFERIATGSMYTYTGKNMGFEQSLQGKINAWESKRPVYNTALYVTRENALSVAQQYRVNASTVADDAQGWKVSDGKCEVYFINTNVKTHAIQIRYFSDAIAMEKLPSEFISDADAWKAGWAFINSTVLPALSHARTQISIEQYTMGNSSSYAAGVQRITTKNMEFKVFYEGYEISWRISINVNWLGEITSCYAPADFSLEREKTMYIGTPIDIMTYYQAHGIPVNHPPANVTDVVITDINIMYAPLPQINPDGSVSVKFTPYYCINYTVFYTDMPVEKLVDYLSVKA
jgi:hypothetical protein